MADGKETQRSLAVLRDRYPEGAVEKVEHWHYYPITKKKMGKKLHDLFGIGDILVVDPTDGWIVVQVTTRKQMSARRQKILGKPQPGDSNPEKMAAYRTAAVKAILGSGGRIVIHGWDQPGGKGTRWVLTEWDIEEGETR